MKKKLAQDLKQFALRIAATEDFDDIEDLKTAARKLYEQLVILSHTDKQPALAEEQPKEEPAEEPAEQTLRFVNPTTADESAAQVRESHPVKQEAASDDLKHHAVHLDSFPVFEPVSSEQIKNEPAPGKNLNKSLGLGLKFGLNDRLAFTQHLFNGSPADFNRVISQLNTLQSFDEAKTFIEEYIKPEYNWEGKHLYEERFLETLEQKMN